MNHFRGSEDGFNTLAAGFVGGAIMFGDNTPINSQINMYIMSRVMVGLARAAVRHGFVKDFGQSFRLYGAVSWALVMYLFYHENDPKHVLQSSMATSMDYLYVQSDSWPNNFVDFLVQGLP